MNFMKWSVVLIVSLILFLENAIRERSRGTNGLEHLWAHWRDCFCPRDRSCKPEHALLFQFRCIVQEHGQRGELARPERCAWRRG